MEQAIVVKTRSQINRRNGALGGVKTTAGKSVSKYNALKHGILKEALTIYEQGSYHRLLQELNSELKPVGFIEKTLVERIAFWYVRLFRNAKAEGEFVKSCLYPDRKPKVKLLRLPCEEGEEVEGYKPTITPEAIERLGEVYSRYDIVFENRISKNLHELERLQRMRLGQQVNAPLMVDVNHFGSFRELDTENQD